MQSRVVISGAKRFRLQIHISGYVKDYSQKLFRSVCVYVCVCVCVCVCVHIRTRKVMTQCCSRLSIGINNSWVTDVTHEMCQWSKLRPQRKERASRKPTVFFDNTPIIYE